MLKNAKANGTRVDVVNIMAFDYYDGKTTRHGRGCDSAAKGLHAQLQRLYPHRSPAALWAMEGNTVLPGIDDYPAKTEVTHLPDVKAVRAFAEKVGISTLSDLGDAARQRRLSGSDRLRSLLRAEAGAVGVQQAADPVHAAITPSQDPGCGART